LPKKFPILTKKSQIFENQKNLSRLDPFPTRFCLDLDPFDISVGGGSTRRRL
jgi:hypothetical protein